MRQVRIISCVAVLVVAGCAAPDESLGGSSRLQVPGGVVHWFNESFLLAVNQPAVVGEGLVFANEDCILMTPRAETESFEILGGTATATWDAANRYTVTVRGNSKPYDDENASTKSEWSAQSPLIVGMEAYQVLWTKPTRIEVTLGDPALLTQVGIEVALQYHGDEPWIRAVQCG